MAVILVHQGPTVTQENYDATVKKLTDGKDSMESASDWPVEGILVHSAGQGPDGFRVVDVWESEEAANAFYGSDAFGAVREGTADMGLESTPWPLHRTEIFGAFSQTT